MPLINANNLPLGQTSSGLPQVSAAVSYLLQPVLAVLVLQQMINGYFKPITTTVQTQASVQPMPEYLVIKLEGERSWKWYVIHILPEVIMQTNDKITLFGIRYKIMSKGSWNQYGYLEYTAIEDYHAVTN